MRPPRAAGRGRRTAHSGRWVGGGERRAYDGRGRREAVGDGRVCRRLATGRAAGGSRAAGGLLADGGPIRLPDLWRLAAHRPPMVGDGQATPRPLPAELPPMAVASSDSRGVPRMWRYGGAEAAGPTWKFVEYRLIGPGVTALRREDCGVYQGMRRPQHTPPHSAPRCRYTS